MTDLTPDPQSERDELASAYLDGQASPEEARRVLGDPTLLTRVEQLRAARDAVRAPGPPVDAARRDAAIAAAIAAALPAPAPVVDEVAAARARRSTPRWLPIAGIAAAIAAALLLVVPQLDRGTDGADAVASKDPTTSRSRTADDGDVLLEPGGGEAGDSSARIEAGVPATGGQAPGSTPDVPTGAGGTTGGAAAAPGLPADPAPAEDQAPTATVHPTSGSTTTTLSTFDGQDTTALATAPPPVLDLGTFADKTAFTAAADAAAADPSGGPRASAAERSQVDACVASLRADAEADGGKVLYAAVAEIDGQPVVAVAIDHGDWRLVRARHREGCGVWFSRTLSPG